MIFVEPTRNPIGFHFDNGFFTSPDAEALYCIVGGHRPRKIVEIESGSRSSTRISRLALMDGEIEGPLVSIGPELRSNIDEFTDSDRCLTHASKHHRRHAQAPRAPGIAEDSVC